MEDLTTLCLLGVFIVVGLLLLPRLLRTFGGGGGMGSPTYRSQGDEEPRYDDPNVRSRGGFGRDRARMEEDDVNRRQDTGYGRRLPNWGWMGDRESRDRGPARRETRRRDNPNVRSRGGFGRDKN